MRNLLENSSLESVVAILKSPSPISTLSASTSDGIFKILSKLLLKISFLTLLTLYTSQVSVFEWSVDIQMFLNFSLIFSTLNVMESMSVERTIAELNCPVGVVNFPMQKCKMSRSDPSYDVLVVDLSRNEMLQSQKKVSYVTLFGCFLICENG